METAVGVFASRDTTEEAVKQLLQRGVPEESIVFLTRSESEAKTISRDVGKYMGGFAGGSAGMFAGAVAASLFLPGIGTVFALGVGAAAALGIAGAGAGAAFGSAAAPTSEVAPTPGEKSSEDAAFFRDVLKEGNSLIVVRTESQEIARSACAVLDQLGLSMQGKTPVRTQISTRQIGDIAVLDISGRITLGEGTVMLRETVRDLVDKGHKRIVLNLADVLYIDSSGMGELVKTHVTIRNSGGELKLANPNKRVRDLLEMTKLSAIFDIQKDEAGAVKSFGGPPPTQA
jgi:anti-sigma B factor antagonist